jgi:hypothetical protein
VAREDEPFESFEWFDRFACSIGCVSHGLVEWLIGSIR